MGEYTSPLRNSNLLGNSPTNLEVRVDNEYRRPDTFSLIERPLDAA